MAIIVESRPRLTLHVWYGARLAPSAHSIIISFLLFMEILFCTGFIRNFETYVGIPNT